MPQHFALPPFQPSEPARRSLAVTEPNIEAGRVAVKVEVVDPAVLVPEALVDNLLKPVPALLLRRKLPVERDVRPAPADPARVRPVAAAAEGLAGGLDAVVGLAVLAAGLGVAGGCEGGGRGGREGEGEGGEGGEVELHGGDGEESCRGGFRQC